MKRTLYHGSSSIIKEPIYGFGNSQNDYGLGFYCCSEVNIAKEWACRNGVGYVNKYTIRDDRLNILDLTKPDNDNVLNWIAILLQYRSKSLDIADSYHRELEYLKQHYLIDVEKYDVIIGYRADDAYFRFPLSFLRSEITIDTLKQVYSLGNLGKQYVLKSKKAFSVIHYEESFEADLQYKNKYFQRTEQANRKYYELLKNSRYEKGTRLIDLVRDDD